MYDDDVSRLDLWVGGMLETDKEPGETFRAITIDQFLRIRDGDRFWYENSDNGYVAGIFNIGLRDGGFVAVLLVYVKWVCIGTEKLLVAANTWRVHAKSNDTHLVLV